MASDPYDSRASTVSGVKLALKRQVPLGKCEITQWPRGGVLRPGGLVGAHDYAPRGTANS
jgi:hypothetical protein